MVPLVALGGYGIFRSYEHQRDAEIEASAELARAVAAGFEAFVFDVMRVEQTIGITSMGHPYDHLARDLRRVAAEHPEIRDMSWIRPDGIVLASSEPALVGRSLFAREYMQDITRGADWRVSPLVPSVVDRAPLFVIARGIRGPGGELRAVVAAAIDANKLGGRPRPAHAGRVDRHRGLGGDDRRHGAGAAARLGDQAANGRAPVD